MASVKAILRESSIKDGEGRIYYRVIQARVVKLVKTQHRLRSCEWDTTLGCVVLEAAQCVERRCYLLDIQRGIDMDLQRLRNCVAYFCGLGVEYTARDILLMFGMRFSRSSFLAFMYSVIEQQHDLGNHRRCEIYNTTYNSFRRFLRGGDVPFCKVDCVLMQAYEAWLKTRVSRNTSSFYLRNLRSMYNRAVECGLVEQMSPFRYVYTGIAKTQKRAVSVGIVRRLRALCLADAPDLEFARDMFMFSFYTRGMAFVDMCYLRKSDLHDGMLVYSRRKTGQTMCIKWEACMQDIVQKYYSPDTPYMLPMIKRCGFERNDYRNMSSKINERLRVVSSMMGLAVPLTMYVARHTWACVARSQNVSMSVISESMGHDSEHTTRIYLSTLDTYEVDRANSLVIDCVI